MSHRSKALVSSKPSRAGISFTAFFHALAFCSVAAAQTRLEPVVVTGTREPALLARSVADIVVIDSSTIQRSSAETLEGLLQREAGMQIIRNGGPGQSTGFFVRGASTNSTVVLVDGVRVGSATLGQAELEAFNLSQIDRIEVLRGPASSLYGADAVGGVVQIFTRRGEGPPRLTAGAEVGGYRSRQGDIGVSGSAGAFDYAVQAARESSRGVSAIREGDVNGYYNPDQDGYTRDSGTVRLGYAPAAGHRLGISYVETRLDAQYDSADFNPPDFTPDPSPDFRNKLTTRVLSADYRGALTGFWTTTVQLSRSLDDLKSGGGTQSRFVTRRTQAAWQNAFRIDAGKQVIVAYEHLEERAEADAFASELGRRNDALVLAGSAQFGSANAHSLQADVRRDNNSAYGGNTTGRVGYAFEALPGLRLRALAGTSFRAPTFNDLYYPGFGVPTIQPERGRSIEIGASWTAGDTRAAVTLWRNHVRDLIGFEPDPAQCPAGSTFGCATNVGRARLQGLSVDALQRFGNLSAALRVELLDARNSDTGERLLRRAAHQESLRLDYAQDRWSVGGSLLVIGSRPDAGVVLGGYGTLDLRAAWRFLPNWQLQARLLNALDHRIEPARDYQGLGRQAWIGVRFDGAGI